jgi:hypothetical protein
MNQELYNMFRSPGIVTVLKVCRLEWLGVCCKNGWCKDGIEITGRQIRRTDLKRIMSNWT